MADVKTLIGTATTGDESENGTVADIVDFKMVTFSLGGKDYGIDIMQVKEIAKFHQFTYVPNTAPYVRGVYNLRGEIISIIDLRLLFNLPAPEREPGKAENGLILRLENNTVGVIVDSIDRVVGLSSSSIQPPHPIFGDINIKYIQGVAQFESSLYIILDVERVFERPEEGDASAVTAQFDADAASGATAPSVVSETAAASPAIPAGEVEQGFLAEGLETYSGYYVSDVNREWFSGRIDDWRAERQGAGSELQFVNANDADAFLRPFFSVRTGAFLDEPYARAIADAIDTSDDSVVQVWNPGTGPGYEAYSLAGALLDKIGDRQLKIWAGDSDLLRISNAPNMVFAERDVPSYLQPYLVEGTNGLSFSERVARAILFEFSDIRNHTSIPRVNAIIVRDVVSFLPAEDQQRIFDVFEERLKPGGLLVLGDNEHAADLSIWKPIVDTTPNMYRIG